MRMRKLFFLLYLRSNQIESNHSSNLPCPTFSECLDVYLVGSFSLSHLVFSNSFMEFGIIFSAVVGVIEVQKGKVGFLEAHRGIQDMSKRPEPLFLQGYISGGSLCSGQWQVLRWSRRMGWASSFSFLPVFISVAIGCRFSPLFLCFGVQLPTIGRCPLITSSEHFAGWGVFLRGTNASLFTVFLSQLPQRASKSKD